MTRGQAEETLRRLLVSEGAAVTQVQGITFARAADAYLAVLETRITSGSPGWTPGGPVRPGAVGWG